MAFSFGQATAAASAPAFSFASSTPAFGAPAAAPAFGSTTPNPFGAPSSTPAFGAPAATSAFGTPAPAPAFGAAFGAAASAPAQSSLFAPAATSSTFGSAASTPAFGFGASSTPALSFGGAFGSTTAAPASTGIFGSALAQPQQQQQQLALQQQQQQQVSSVISYSTKFEELPADKQAFMQQMQQEVSTYRDENRALDEDARLHDATAMRKGMQEVTSALKQSLTASLNAVRTDDDALASFREKVLALLRSTEYTVRMYVRSRQWRELPQGYRASGQAVPQAIQEALAQPVVLPNPYLEQAVQGFQEALHQYKQCIHELEAALPPAGYHGSDSPVTLEQLPVIISHMHDYFVHVAAQLERVHVEVQQARTAYLAQLRAGGDMTDPFEESRRYQRLSSGDIKSSSTPPSYGGLGGGGGGAGGGGGSTQGTAGFGGGAAGGGGSPSPFAGTPGTSAFGSPSTFGLLPGASSVAAPKPPVSQSKRSTSRGR